MRCVSSLLALAAGAWAQQSSASVDPNTGIKFQGMTAAAGFYFGMAVPKPVGSDFIGQMVVPITTGYGGLSLTGSMVGSLLVVAWPNENKVVSSLRETRGYTSPVVYANASISLIPIANGTFVNSTHMSYTFLCQGCIMGSAFSFKADAEMITVGFSFSKTAPNNPSSAESATFVFHEAGHGAIGLALNLAGSQNFAKWASMATASPLPGNSTTPASGGSNSTCTTTTKVANSTYDYIVAGAGPAGIIAAQRLAETGKSVLLLERGQASTFASGGKATVAWNEKVTQYDVPSMAYYLTTAADTSEHCTDTANMAGCLLGGGTMVNALMFVRPQDADFNDKWPTGWKWSEVSASAAKLYKRNPGTTLASKDQQRYDQGAFQVFSTFFKTLGWSQVDAIKEPNRKTKIYSFPAWDIQDGLRAGPVKSYLPLARALSNFELTLNTKVVRVIRNGSTATGVEVEISTGARQIIKLKTGGSVILASGSMSSPRILYNSGIGPADQLTTVKTGYACVTLPDKADWIDLPVGKNLKDHPIYTLTFNTSSANSSMVAKDFTSPSQINIDLFSKQSGPLVQSGQRINFWTSMNTTSGTKYFQGTCNSPGAGQLRIKLYLTHGATSVGTLGINAQGATIFTTDPWMNTEDDKTAVAVMIDQILNAAKNSTILKPSDSKLTGASMVAKKSFASGSHFVGTAIMGETKNGSAVVDTDTKVFGTDNIFVVDASIHPDLPTGNTQAIVMVVAEHAVAKIIALGASAASNSTTTPSQPAPPYVNATTNLESE
ncbi:related to cellobiose dehydrogenase [Rhynchosporium agropyri]|uniref:Related to cellobiose dehydrogenase n=1 Tax=Rhynchosporium agropyri TaxID=914238 RepID=A0A1E1L0W6_9HELO|nr:related to cellobiose dehydrogenase [Rhynchosporium agropyri]